MLAANAARLAAVDARQLSSGCELEFGGYEAPLPFDADETGADSISDPGVTMVFRFRPLIILPKSLSPFGATQWVSRLI
jgi:hypothetical protein